MTDDSSPLASLSLSDLRRRTSEKWRHYPNDVLPLWVAEMDAPLAEPIRRALVTAANDGDLGYAIASGYLDALGEFARRRWRWDGVTPDHGRAVANVMTGVAAAIGALTEPGDHVVINCPVYPPFYSYTENSGRVVEEAPLGEDGRLDFDVLEGAFARAQRASRHPTYLLCSPHNPTGTLHRPDELTRVLELARTYGVRVIADEIHAPLVLRGTFTPLLSLPSAQRSVAVLSASKAFNLAGAPVAALVVGDDARDVLATLEHRVVPGPSHLGVIAQGVALREGDPWLDELLVELAARQDLLTSLLAAHLPNVGYRPGDATYLAWLDVRALGLHDASDARRGGADALSGPAAHFLEHARVALSDGAAFGAGGTGHLRLNFATSESILTQAVECMGRVAR